MIRTALLAAVASASLLGMSGPAFGDTVLSVVRSVKPEWEKPVRASAEDAVRKRRHAVLPLKVAVVDRGLNPAEFAACAKNGQTCFAEKLAGLGTDRAVLLAIEASDDPDGDGDFIITGWFVKSSDGNTLAGDRRFCEQCTQGRAVDLSKELVGALMDTAASNAAPETMLEIRTNVPAKLIVDGNVLGQTGQAYRVSPGNHTIRLERPGYRTVSRSIAVETNETKSLVVELLRPDTASPASPSARWIPWSMAGVGAAAITLGSVWIIAHEAEGDADAGDCDAPGGCLRAERNNSLVPGIVTVTLGAAAVGTAVWMMLRDTDEVATQVTVAPRGNGALVGVAGRF